MQNLIHSPTLLQAGNSHFHPFDLQSTTKQHLEYNTLTHGGQEIRRGEDDCCKEQKQLKLSVRHHYSWGFTNNSSPQGISFSNTSLLTCSWTL